MPRPRRLPLLPASTPTLEETFPTDPRLPLVGAAGRRVPALHVLRSLNRTIPRTPNVPPMTAEELTQRPRVRGDCAGVPRPCPWYGCRHHLGLDVHPSSGNIRINIDVDELDESTETCALDLAHRGGASLDEVGRALGVTRERARQMQDLALRKLARKPGPVAARYRQMGEPE